MKGGFMRSKTKTLLLGGLLAGSLVAPAHSVMARDFWHWHEREHRWERRAERSEESDLAEARRQLEYDREHHAIRSRIAEHEARIRDIERDLKGELREHDRD
jgi:hypothetical protein